MKNVMACWFVHTLDNCVDVISNLG